MSDRPTAVNGKRNQAWGTTAACPKCGECLCFGCHPYGPCVDEHGCTSSAADTPAVASGGQAFGAWTFTAGGGVGMAGVDLRRRQALGRD